MVEKIELVLSALNHTWILDLDGTLVKHNGYLIDGEDTLLPGAHEFLEAIPDGDMIIFLTSRKKSYEIATKNFLNKENIKYHLIIFDVPYGERIVINDKKKSGMETAKAINVDRNKIEDIEVVIDIQL